MQSRGPDIADAHFNYLFATPYSEQDHLQPSQPWRSQPCSATCSFKRAMAIATRTVSCRSSAGERFRSRTSPRIRPRASINSLSSLACSGQLIARVEVEYITHLLKTANGKLASRRRKSKQYFRLIFARGRGQPISSTKGWSEGWGDLACASRAPKRA
jgi:hypothetical protein